MSPFLQRSKFVFIWVFKKGSSHVHGTSGTKNICVCPQQYVILQGADMPRPRDQRGWDRAKNASVTWNASVRLAEQLWWVVSISRHWTVTEWLHSQSRPTHWIEFDCSLAFWAYGFFTSLIVSSQNCWDTGLPTEFTIHGYQPANCFIWRSHISAFASVPSSLLKLFYPYQALQGLLTLFSKPSVLPTTSF